MVTPISKKLRNHIFDLVTWIFDLWPWPSNSSEILSRSIPIWNFVSICQAVWPWERWRTDRRKHGKTDRRTDGNTGPILLPRLLTYRSIFSVRISNYHYNINEPDILHDYIIGTETVQYIYVRPSTWFIMLMSHNHGSVDFIIYQWPTFMKFDN